MKHHLYHLMTADYRLGYTNGHGADGTVRSLEMAGINLETSDGPDASANLQRAELAERQSKDAAYNLERRLFSAYIIRALSSIRLGQLDKAKTEYNKAVALVDLATQSHGLPASLSPSESEVEETLALVERRLRLAGVAL